MSNRERIADDEDLQIFHGREKLQAREAGKLQEQAKQAKALRASLCALQQQARDLHDRALTSSSAAGDGYEGFLADIKMALHPLLNLWRVWQPNSEAGE